MAGNFSLSTFSAVQGSWSVYRVDVRHHHSLTTKPKSAQVSLVANFPDSIMLGGITVLNSLKEWLLVSDSAAGIVYRLDAKTGKAVKMLKDPLMKLDSSVFGIGVSSIPAQNGHLYFTNTNQNILARISIKDDSTSRASASVVAQIDDPEGLAFIEYHDVFVVQNKVDSLGCVDENALGAVTTITTPANGTDSNLFGPTGLRVGKVRTLDPIKEDWHKNYISTNQHQRGHRTVT